MDRDQVPVWLKMMVGFFAITTMVGFGSFLWNYAEVERLGEQIVETEAKLDELSPIAGEIEKEILPAMQQAIQVRRDKDVDLDKSDEDEITATKSSLSPKHDTALARLKNLNETKLKRLERLMGEAKEARLELVTAQEQRLEAETSGQEERRRLRDKIEELSVQIEDEKRKQLKTLLDLEAELAKRKKRIAELLDRRETKVDELISDGQLLEARVLNGFVVLNRGLYDDIKFAQRFVVFNRRAGQNRIKGEVEVIEVQPHISVARVINEVDANDPLVPGDHIHNNIYNPDETKIYVVAGDFDLYSQAELKRFIEDAGGQVDPAITAKTHYLVAGHSNADEALAKASLNGVTVLSENQLLETIRRTERFEIERGMTFALAGEFTIVPRSVIEQFVKTNGGVITANVDADTNFLIAGDNAADAISQAYLAGATVINQTQLRTLVNTGISEGE